MKNDANSINDFFNEYAKRFNDSLTGKNADVEGTAQAFSEWFIEASPVGISGSKNDKKFREAIPQGYAFYKSIGTKSMTITSKEISLLDDLHAMVKICWRSTYKKKDNTIENIDFEVHYFLQTREEEMKIFAYITGDEQKVLTERGLIT